MRSPWFWFVFAGYTIRIVLMPVTGQHDVMFMAWMTHFINQGHSDIYAFLYTHFGDIVMHRPGVWAPYPYGFYIFTAGWLAILEKIGAINLSAWDSIWQVAHPARYVFLLKLAYLPFDMAIGYILYRNTGENGLILWALSPIAIYTPFMMGQNDIYATAFTMLGVHTAASSIESTQDDKWFGVNRGALLSILFLGIGSLFKIFPLMLIPPMALITQKTWRQRLFSSLIGSLIFGLMTLPFLNSYTFVNGVLFNPEGSKVFDEIQLLGVNFAPFPVAYILLLVVLASRGTQSWTASQVWSVALLVMTLLFLIIPTPFYWLIWITPLLIVVTNKSSIMFFAWLALQIGFGISLLGQHRELGVALPIHLEPMFNMPNLSTTLAITNPDSTQTFSNILNLGNSLLVLALIIGLWYTVNSLRYPAKTIAPEFESLAWVGLPMLVMSLGLITNLNLARDLISETYYYNWENKAISSKDVVVQEFTPKWNPITGMRLRFINASQAAEVKVCLYRDKDLEQQSLTCASENTSRQRENGFLYFVFDRNEAANSADALVASIRVETLNTFVVFPFARTNTDQQHLHFNDDTLDGTLDIAPLSHFSFRYVFDNLIVKNVFQDRWLVFSIIVTEIAVLLFLILLPSTIKNQNNE